VEFRILGEPEVLADGQALSVGGRRTRAVLAMLVLRANAVVPADLLREELWPDRPGGRAAANLQVRLSELRGALRSAGEDERLVTQPSGYLLRAWPDEVDATRFELLTDQGRAALESGDAQLAAARLRAALGLWHGPALGELASEPFARSEAARLEEARLAALELRIESDLACGADATLVAELEALTVAHPLRERLWAQRMLALYRAGRQAEALRCYQQLRRALVEEVGIEPGSEVRRLEELILRQDAALHRPRTAPPGTDHGDAGSAPEVPPTQYALNGDIHLAYQVIGTGPPDILFVPGLISHLDLWWEDPAASRFLRSLAGVGRLILFDKRDTGLSDRALGDSTLEDCVGDLGAVLDACGSRRAALLGYSEGAPMSLLFAVTHPERVTALILGSAAACWDPTPDYPCGHESPALFSAFEQLARDGWGTGASIDWYAPSHSGSARARQRMARWERMSVSPNALLRMLRFCRSIDVRSLLPAVHTPTLVVQRLDDRITPPCHGRYLASAIEGARYFEQPGGHLLWVGDSDALVDEIEELLTGFRRAARRDRVLRTLVVATGAGPQRSEPQGGQDGPSWARYAAGATDAIVGQGGRVVKSSELGVLATFDGPARAIRCTGALRQWAADLDIEVRLGIHTGEVDIVDDDVSGISVDIARELAALALPGEVLVSRTVKDLVVGSGISFTDRGDHQLPDVPDRWSVFAVH
jgi:DNA-binding SARP family transcriptional activator/pimeloyl-ACP methyl ester carboxylesterase/class 3 adenylate cyclase